MSAAHSVQASSASVAAPALRGPCLLRLELLPQAALDAVFAALTPREAGRACCVSRAWKNSLSAPHLWARVDFVRAGAEREYARNVAPGVVRGACIKAGDALRAVRLAAETARLLVPIIAALHPGLESVTLVASPWCHTLSQEELAVCLRGSPPLRELHADVCVTLGAEAAEDDALLTHAALRASGLTLTAHASRLGDVAAAVRRHARTAEAVTLTWLNDDAAAAAPTEVHSAALADALCSCTALRRLALPHRALSAAAFDAVAAALRASPCALSHVSIAAGAVEAHLPSVARRLLPRLVSLELSTAAPRTAEAAQRLATAQRCLADALRSGDALALTSLTLDDRAGGVGAADVLSALSSTRLTSLHLLTGQAGARDGADVAALARSLPPCLASLTLTDASADVPWAHARDALLRGLAHLPALTSLHLERADSFDAPDCDAVAALLLRGAPGGACPPSLRELTLSADGGPVHGAWRVAAALHGCTALTSLSLPNGLDDELLLSLALVLPHCSLRTLDAYARLPRQLGAPAVRAFAARLGLGQAARLASLQLGVSGALEALAPPAVAPQYRDLCRALMELRNVAHPTCVIHVDLDD
jgi:hypothetical protein